MRRRKLVSARHRGYPLAVVLALSAQAACGVSDVRPEKLREYPELADAIGIFCVRDCATALAYMRAYREYEKAHPDFDLEQEVGPMPPRPPRPPRDDN